MAIFTPQGVYERYNMLYVRSRYSDAYALILPYAEQGFAYAQYCMGMHYLMGYGVSKNHYIAFHWLEFASQNGHRMAKKILKCMRDDNLRKRDAML
jgi:TPR repeat protein